MKSTQVFWTSLFPGFSHTTRTWDNLNSKSAYLWTQWGVLFCPFGDFKVKFEILKLFFASPVALLGLTLKAHWLIFRTKMFKVTNVKFLLITNRLKHLTTANVPHIEGDSICWGTIFSSGLILSNWCSSEYLGQCLWDSLVLVLLRDLLTRRNKYKPAPLLKYLYLWVMANSLNYWSYTYIWCLDIWRRCCSAATASYVFLHWVCLCLCGQCFQCCHLVEEFCPSLHLYSFYICDIFYRYSHCNCSKRYNVAGIKSLRLWTNYFHCLLLLIARWHSRSRMLVLKLKMWGSEMQTQCSRMSKF